MQTHTTTTLIAEAGSTKIDWALLYRGRCLVRFTTTGINALSATDEAILSMTAEAAKGCGEILPSKICYFGAGCATKTASDRIRKALSSTFKIKDVSVESDLPAAALALCGNDDGIVCILGTGSNSCLWKEGRIAANVPPLGYVLGDECSGAAIGKRILADALRGIMPADLRQELMESLGLDLSYVLDKTYRQEAPNRFLASVATFFAAHSCHPYVKGVFAEEFRRFLFRNVALYPGSRQLKVHFAGSLAFLMQSFIKDILLEEGYIPGKIVKSPIDGLIQYFLNKNE